jgi:hypothetical protein
MADAEAPNQFNFTLDRFDRHGTTQARANDEWVSEHGIPGEQVRAEIIAGKRPRARILRSWRRRRTGWKRPAHIFGIGLRRLPMAAHLLRGADRA